MVGMFYECKKLKQINGINNFNTSKVINMYAMFSKCNELEYLDLSNFDISSATDITGMFYGCHKLKQIKGIDKFKNSNISGKDELFSESKKLNFSSLSDKDSSNNDTNSKNEKPISIIFTSVDQKVHYSLVCYESDIFEKVEQEFYEEYPELKNKEIIFLFNGGAINTSATLKQNKIKNSAIILINYID